MALVSYSNRPSPSYWWTECLNTEFQICLLTNQITDKFLADHRNPGQAQLNLTWVILRRCQWPDYIASKGLVDEWWMHCKGHGTKQSWLTRGTVPVPAWMDWGKLRNISVSTAGARSRCELCTYWTRVRSVTATPTRSVLWYNRGETRWTTIRPFWCHPFFPSVGSCKCINVHCQSAVYSAIISYGMDQQRSIPSRGKDFSLHHHVQTSLQAQPASYPSGAVGSFPRLKRPGREACTCTSTPYTSKWHFSFTSYNCLYDQPFLEKRMYLSFMQSRDYTDWYELRLNYI
jgi:hypothetical protein